MKKLFLFLILIAVLMPGGSFGQDASVRWSRQMGGTGSETGHSIAVDTAGNVYTTGIFEDTADFNPGPGSYFLEALGGEDVFISKLDSGGNFLWAKRLSGTADEFSWAIGADNKENVYVAGYFNGTVDFDPAATIFNLTSEGSADLFLCKLDKNGNFRWAKRMGGPGNDRCFSLALDTSANIFLTGHFSDTVDFDPGPVETKLISYGAEDAFICMFDSTGSFKFVKQLGGTENDQGYHIACDDSGNIYTTGHFRGTADLDPGTSAFIVTSVTPVYQDIFVSKLNKSGNFVLAKTIGGTDLQLARSIAVDTAGNIHLAGVFKGTTDFDPGDSIYSLTVSSGWENIFVCKLNRYGDFAWARQMGGNNSADALAMALDSCGNVYTTGRFNGIGDFDPDTTSYSLAAAGDEDAFISKLDSAGKFVWARNFGGAQDDYSWAIALDRCADIFLTGYFMGSADMDPSPAIFNFTSLGLSDAFVSKLNGKSCYPMSQAPTGASAEPSTICQGEITTLTEIGGSLAEGSTWAWYADSCGGQRVGTGATITGTPGSTTTYYVRAENPCEATACATVTVNVKTKPFAYFSTQYESDCEGINARFTNQSLNAHQYKWLFGDGDVSTDVNPTHSYDFTSSFTVMLIAINNNGCRDTISGNYFVPDFINVTIPNIFTPNNDGVNDEFEIDVGADLTNCFSIVIFNRWGEKVFSSNDPGFKWDGKTPLGSKASQGTYFYVIGINGGQYRGFITLAE